MINNFPHYYSYCGGLQNFRMRSGNILGDEQAPESKPVPIVVKAEPNSNHYD